MKLILTALNAKYIHTCLSVRCLNAAVKDICSCTVKEYTINDTLGDICRDLFLTGADCIAFSCYIWNIEMVLKIASALKKANPGLKIILGGYEVMYDCEDIMSKNPQIDAVIRGEGEVTLREYLLALDDKMELSSVYGLTYKEGGEVVSNPDRTKLCDLESLPFVYDESIEEFKNKIIYYESSRGCPYRCTYCISGHSSGVRFLSAPRVKKELKFFMEHGVPLVKFVDRTFNANPRRAVEILNYIADNPSDTVFHMELAGDIINDEMIEAVSRVRKDSLRFEIGVQTTNPHTMEAIERNISFPKLSRAVKALLATGRVHVHLDLIAGLPKENLLSFKKSFEDVIMLRPHVLQLGFLKLLKGSKIRAQEEMYNYRYSDAAPYEVISNDFVTYEDILEIKCAEDALDKYYNSGSFAYTMDFLFGNYPCKFDMFLKVGKYIRDTFKVGYAFSKQELFSVLYDCMKDEGAGFIEALKKDYLINFRIGKRPHWFGDGDDALTAKLYDMFRNEKLKKEHFPEYYDVPAKEIMKHMYAERFSEDVLLFDYKHGTVRSIGTFLS